jgi:hypothetical protein
MIVTASETVVILSVAKDLHLNYATARADPSPLAQDDNVVLRMTT